jgi:flagellar biosynthesis protein FlhB
VAENQEDRSRDDLTEEASPYRLEEFRRRGIVAQSREISGLAALLAAGTMAYTVAPRMGQEMAEFMREVFRTDLSSRLDLGSTHVLAGHLIRALKVMGIAALPVCVIGFVLGAFSSFAQIGSVFSTEPLTPDFSRIDPLKGARRVFFF